MDPPVSAPVSRPPQLPAALLRAVFAFLAAPSAPREWRRMQNAQAAGRALQTVAQVSREWRAAAHAVHTSLLLRTLSIEVVGGATTRQALRRVPSTRTQLLELRRRATLRGAAFLRELDVTPPTCAFTADDWRSIVVYAPLLETLDLRHVPRGTILAFCKPVIEAVASRCPRLRALQLPWVVVFSDAVESPEDTAELLDTVLRGLAQWAPRGGLRRLTLPMPFVRMENHHRLASTYLNVIAECCPRLELLDGHDDMTLSIDRLTCDEQWHVDTTTWARFCASCTQLTAFNWVVAPFATAFFEIFGRVRKPQLTSLTFATPMNWDWNTYHRHLPSLHHQGFGATAVDAHAALRACPALTSLDVQLYQPGDLHGLDLYDDHTSVNPDQLMLNQEIFGDAFCAAIARHCTQLERVTIWCVAESATDHQLTIRSFTDASMRALASLPRLTWMQLPSVNITGDGLLALCTGFAHGDVPRQRDYEIGVGDKSGTAHALAFYEVVEQFLTKLATPTDDEPPCAASSQRVLLRLLNKCYDNVDRHWSQGFLARVRPLLAAAKRNHPSFRLRMMTRAFFQHDSFDCVFEFNFYSADAEISDEYEWDDENDSPIDDVFVDRGFGGRGGFDTGDLASEYHFGEHEHDY